MKELAAQIQSGSLEIKMQNEENLQKASHDSTMAQIAKNWNGILPALCMAAGEVQEIQVAAVTAT